MLADENRREVSAEHMRSAEGTQSAAADTRSVEGMQVDYLEKARKLADSYSFLLQRKAELEHEIEESRSWFYTRDDAIYKLSMGAHEEWMSSCRMWRSGSARSAAQRFREMQPADRKSSARPDAGTSGGQSIRNRSTGHPQG